MSNERLEARRAQHQRYKEDVKRTGKPFYPYAMFHDTVMSLAVVVIILALTVLWHETADGTKAGILGPLYDDPADAGTFQFVPRPDWYFYFLFYLLRIFKWPNSVFLGTVGVPTIGLILLLALPFIDLRRERRLSHRPVAIVAFILVVLSMGTLTWKGATAKEASGSDTKRWQSDVHFSNAALTGAGIVAESGCLNCHTYDGDGSSNLGAPDLTAIGNLGNADFFAKYVANPSKYGNNVMPHFESLGAQKLAAIGLFLSQSKGKK